MTQSPQPFHTDASRDGSSLLSLAHWLDEIDHDLADLTARVRNSRRNEADVYHTARTRALGEAMAKVTGTVSDLLSVLPGGTDGSDSPESRLVCMGLISQWLHNEAQSSRSAQAGIHGNTDSFHLPTVLEFLATQKKTGLVKILASDETFFLELADGDLVHAASDNAPAGERLGEVLVEMGYLTRDQLTSMVSLQSRPRARIGLELCERGLVDEHQLTRALECQVRRILQRLFEKRGALFEFHEKASQRQPIKVRLATVPLLLEVAKKHDDAQLEREHESAATPVSPTPVRDEN